MNRKKIPFAAVILLLLLPSCFNSKDLPESEPVKLREFTPADLIPAKSVAENFANGFFAAVKANDFAPWEKVMPARNIQQYKTQFPAFYNELHVTFGDFEGAEYLGEVNNADLKNFLWKMRFSKVENGKKITREVVFFVRVHCEENKQPDISGFGVKLF